MLSLSPVGGHNIHDEQAGLSEPDKWPRWQKDLLEEIVHEYEHKIICGNATPAGQTLFGKFGQKFDEDPRGHGATFFSALDQVASLIGLSPESLITGIK